VSCDVFSGHTHAHSPTSNWAARTSHANVCFAPNPSAPELAHFTIYFFIVFFRFFLNYLMLHFDTVYIIVLIMK
jgi:hypothetical protein